MGHTLKNLRYNEWYKLKHTRYIYYFSSYMCVMPLKTEVMVQLGQATEAHTYILMAHTAAIGETRTAIDV